MKTATLNPKHLARRKGEFERALNLFSELDALLVPPTRQTLSEWADENRILPRSSAEPGRWDTRKTPYMKPIMDACSDPAVQRIVVVAASQVGKTESLVLNFLGYLIDTDPCDVMIVMPNQNSLERLSKKRLSRLFLDTECLRQKVAASKSRSSDSTLYFKAFEGGSVILVSAGSPSQLSADPIRILICDEIDRWPVSAGSEGNPVELAIKRTATFWNKKIVLISSPGVEETSRIWPAYQHSTQEQWNIPCPVCDRFQVMDIDRLDYASLRHKCVHCGALSEQHEWQACSQRGKSIAKNPGHRTRGFHLDCLPSPWVDWSDLKSEWFEASHLAKECRDPSSLQVFRNTRLALPWSMHCGADKLSHEALMERREVYPGEVPDGALILTCGVDVQENRIVAEVAGWGVNRQRWGLGYHILYGSILDEEVWKELDALLEHEFVRSDGLKLKISRTFVDSGFQASLVYAWTKSRQPRVFAIKGQGGEGLPVICGKRQVQDKSNATLILIGSDAAKDAVWARLNVAESGPAFWCFPKTETGGPALGYDEEFFKGLVSERRIVRYKNAQKKTPWERMGHLNNEPWDCACYSYAALEFLGGLSAIERAAEAIQSELNPPRQFRRPPDPRRYVVKPENAPPPGGFGSTEESSPFGAYRPKSGRGNF